MLDGVSVGSREIVSISVCQHFNPGCWVGSRSTDGGRKVGVERTSCQAISFKRGR